MGVLNMLSVLVPQWHDQGLCRKYDSALWLNSSPNSKKRKVAIAICNQCPVRRDCLRWIVELENRVGTTDTGVYGGYSEFQRKALRLRYLAIYGTPIKEPEEKVEPLDPVA